MRRFTIVFASVLACVCLLLVHSAQAEKTFVCQPGASYTFKGTAPANTALLLFFDGRPVGGTTSDASGMYRVRLTLGQETPGAYPIAVQVRESHQVVTSATCVIPVPGTAVSAAIGGAAPSTTPNAQRGVQPTAASGITPTVTVSPTPNQSITATTQTRATSAATATAATPTATATGTQPTATGATATGATATGATATTSPTGSTTATVSPTVTATTDSSDEPDLEIDSDENPEAGTGKDYTLSGSVTDSDGNAVSSLAVTVTFAYDDVTSSAWCTATTGADGTWTCKRTVDAGLKGKDVTWTMTITLKGKTYTEDFDDTPQ